MPNLRIACIEFYDDGPDEQGRRHFALTWWSTGAAGTENPETGLRWRGQHFHMNPDRIAPRIV